MKNVAHASELILNQITQNGPISRIQCVIAVRVEINDRTAESNAADQVAHALLDLISAGLIEASDCHNLSHTMYDLSSYGWDVMYTGSMR